MKDRYVKEQHLMYHKATDGSKEPEGNPGRLLA